MESRCRPRVVATRGSRRLSPAAQMWRRCCTQHGDPDPERSQSWRPWRCAWSFSPVAASIEASIACPRTSGLPPRVSEAEHFAGAGRVSCIVTGRGPDTVEERELQSVAGAGRSPVGQPEDSCPRTAGSRSRADRSRRFGSGSARAPAAPPRGPVRMRRDDRRRACERHERDRATDRARAPRCVLLEHDLPVESAVQSARGARDRQVCVRQRGVLLERSVAPPDRPARPHASVSVSCAYRTLNHAALVASAALANA